MININNWEGDLMSLSERLRNLRQEKGLSMMNVGKKLGLGISTISQYETGKRVPNAEILKVLADFYGVSIDYLVRGEEPTKKENQPSNKKTADLDDDDVIFTYEGKEIPPEDLEYMKRILRGGKE